MKSYNAPVAPDRMVLPKKRYYPHEPIDGEILYIDSPEERGIRVYDAQEERWIPIFATSNNIWESQTSTDQQHLFELENEYIPNGKSITVYVDGVRLPANRVVELNKQAVVIKEDYDDHDRPIYLKEGQFIEFQIFNVKE